MPKKKIPKNPARNQRRLIILVSGITLVITRYEGLFLIYSSVRFRTLSLGKVQNNKNFQTSNED